MVNNTLPQPFLTDNVFCDILCLVSACEVRCLSECLICCKIRKIGHSCCSWRSGTIVQLAQVDQLFRIVNRIDIEWNIFIAIPIMWPVVVRRGVRCEDSPNEPIVNEAASHGPAYITWLLVRYDKSCKKVSRIQLNESRCTYMIAKPAKTGQYSDLRSHLQASRNE